MFFYVVAAYHISHKSIIRERRLNWFGHKYRMDSNRSTTSDGLGPFRTSEGREDVQECHGLQQ